MRAYVLEAKSNSISTVSIKFLVSVYLFAIAYFEIHDRIKKYLLLFESLNTQFM